MTLTISFLFYLVLNKKDYLIDLFQLVGNMQVYNFIKQDFTLPQNQIAALKIAYTLLSKQKYELAAGYFLLAEYKKDCLNIISHKLKDYKLALVISYLIETKN